MTFWDASALLSLLLKQGATEELLSLADSDRETAFWWGTEVEAASAISRARRRQIVNEITASHLWKRFEAMALDAREVEPTEAVRDMACRLLRRHDLRAGDALQLAAALVWADHHPSDVRFVCLDRRLRVAAEWEGFEVLPRER